jgi:hypothetical protein
MNPVVKVIDEQTGDWVYSLRIKGSRFRPKVFKVGSYTVEIGEGDLKKTLTGIDSIGLDDKAELKVTF